MSASIKQYVESAASETSAPPESIWRAAQAAYPHKKVSWLYVLRLVRGSRPVAVEQRRKA